MELSLFDTLIIVLTIAVVVVVLCKYLKLPPIIGYIGVGIISGPHIMAWLPDTQPVHSIAGFGIVFLMFTVGLEFSLSRMVSMKHLVFGLGSAQVLLTVMIVTICGYWLTLTWDQAITLGCIVSLSSTAMVSKQLDDIEQLNSRQGHRAISILLFQDLAVIPFFILISSFGKSSASLSIPLLMALGKTTLTIIVILSLGRWVFRPLFKEIVAIHSEELFTLSVLLVTLISAWITHRLGLSLAMGAFMAGMMLGETEYRHQIEATIRPFRDLLLGLFFITIGMLFNIFSLKEIWPWVLMLFLAFTGLKIIIITVLCRLTKSYWRVAVRTGIILAQGSEFGFALLALGMSENLFPPAYEQVILGALLLSLITAPFLISHNKTFAKWIIPKSWFDIEDIKKPSPGKLFTQDLAKHVIICGFGRNGQNIAKLLEDEEIPYIGVDHDPELVHHCQKAGLPVIYGDSSHYSILVACKIAKSKAIVVTFEDIHNIERILPQVRTHFEKLPIFVRTHDDASLEYLQSLGATEVIPATLETSLTLASHVLLEMGVSAKRVVELMGKIRKTRYRLLREMISE
ncbi:MAG: cation:proton antiporter [Gammaproteobacteria bacterium]|nr:cation:proton antiporter [Gammaproteobacteria bacterium]